MAQNGTAQNASLVVLGDQETEIKILYNPKEYSLTHRTSYKENPIAGTDLVYTQFLHGNPGMLQVSLFIDQSAKLTIRGREEGEDVSDKVKQIIALLHVDAARHRPPSVRFQWGSMKFTGVITNIGSKYTRFDKEGMPTRATLDLTIMEVIDPGNAARKTPFESPDRTKYRLVSAGNSLWNIAYEEYGSMAQWRAIALENNLMNPLELAMGTTLKVPAL